MDNGKRDEITQDWIAECVCGWWRSIVLPIAQDGDAPNSKVSDGGPVASDCNRDAIPPFAAPSC